MTGHNSIILMIEAQSRYLSTLIQSVAKAKSLGKSLTIIPNPDILHQWNDDVQARLNKSSFADSCQSWYKTESGRVTNNWDGTAVQYQKEMERVAWDDYIVEGTGKQLVKGKRVYVGRVVEEMPISYTALIMGVVALVAGGVGYMNGLTGERVRQWVGYLGSQLKAGLVN